MSTELITGATGKIGSRLFASLQSGHNTLRVLGRYPGNTGMQAEHVPCDLQWAAADELERACAGVHTLYHCAGYAHAFKTLANNDAELHRRINADATMRLAEAAGRAGVRRFIFLSSVKAAGIAGTVCGDESSAVPPVTAYGQAKAAAEQALLAAGAQYRMEVVNLRLAMVYGGKGRGNLERMVAMVRRGWFPPLPETGNKRSLLYVDDAVDAIQRVAHDPRASGRTYIVADAEAYSGRALYNAIRHALGLKPCRFSIPYAALAAAARAGDGLEALCRKRMPFDTEMLEKLLGSDWYSSGRIARELGWHAKTSLQDGLKRMLTPSDSPG